MPPPVTRATCDQTKEMSEISVMLSKLDKKMDVNQKQFNTKIDNIRNDLSVKLDDQLINIRSEISSSLELFRSDIEANVKALVNEQSARIDSVVASVVDNDRVTKLNDVIIRGIPYHSGENLLSIFQSIAKVIKFKPDVRYSVNNVFRLGNGNKPILVQFVSQILKRQFMVKYFSKKNLNLSHIGIVNNENRIYCSDNLTADQNNIYVRAVQLLKSKRLNKVNTRNGFVYVKYLDADNFVKINQISELPELDIEAEDLDLTVRESTN